MKHADLKAGESYHVQESKYGAGWEGILVSTDRVASSRGLLYSPSPDDWTKPYGRAGNRVVLDRGDSVQPRFRYQAVTLTAIIATTKDYRKRQRENERLAVEARKQRAIAEEKRAAEKAAINADLATLGITIPDYKQPRQHYSRTWEIDEDDLLALIAKAKG